MRGATQPTSFDQQSATGNLQLLAWQGWAARVPDDWNAVKLDGDHRQGLVLLADLERPRLGFRWSTPPKKADPAQAVQAAMIAEVGTLAAAEARKCSIGSDWRASLVYVEPEPPGRDLWVAVSATTGRLIQVVYHAKSRDRVLEKFLPQLADTPVDQPQRWAALDLSCVTPPGMMLAERSFAAGDLRLAFEDRDRRVVVRQLGPAELALARQPLSKWLAQHPLALRQVYRQSGAMQEVSIEINGERHPGLKQTFHRRRRFVLYWRHPAQMVVMAAHDPTRDRIVIVQAGDENLAREMIAATGTA